ncbi:MAG: hypothetical protein RMA76_36560 [Deltaproteobacteria bacterium]|jgi:hypothetical protein
MTKSNRRTPKARWAAARTPQTTHATRPIDPKLKTLQDRTSDMGTIFSMLARIRSERG